MIKEIKQKRLPPRVISIIELLEEQENESFIGDGGNLLFIINRNDKIIVAYIWTLLSHFNEDFDFTEYDIMNKTTIEAIKNSKYSEYTII